MRGPSSGEGAAKPQPLSAFQAILDTNMFGAKRTAATPAAEPTPAAAVAAATPQEAAPPGDKLPFRLILTGTFRLGKSALAFVIGPDGRTERVYALKECLPRNEDEPVVECQPNQGRLVEIAGDHIVVAMNGATYVVELDEAKPPEAPEPVAARGRVRVNADRRPSRPDTGPPQQGAAAAFPATREGDNILITVPNAEVEKAFENFAGIVNQARVVPHLVDGQPQGFLIRKIKAGSIFERLGLSNQDIIKSVNGESLTTADQALRLFSLFRNEREINLEIERNEEPLNLSYTIE